MADRAAFPFETPVKDVFFAFSESAEQTKAMAAALAPALREGDVIALAGDLGAGKTQFVQGLASGLGVQGEVTSPTFNILLCYDGDLPLYHFDLYRLETPDQLEDIDFYETIEGDGVSCIEWSERFPDELPDDMLRVELTVPEGTRRCVYIEATGARGAALLEQWASALVAGSAEGK